jgi:tRNA (guanine-N7-)-methyltransferase
MRQKNVKNATTEFLNSYGVINDRKKVDLNNQLVFLEIGSGKGKFISTLAKNNPNNLYIAMEININVCYRVLEKKLEMHLDNLMIILDDANHLKEYFAEKSIDGIYLNFSDPWPKKRHHKRRLTNISFLKMYKEILKDDSFIQFRTDHIDLFNDSILYIKDYFDIVDLNYDLKPSELMTEYEEKKRLTGKIYQLIGKR